MGVLASTVRFLVGVTVGLASQTMLSVLPKQAFEVAKDRFQQH